MKLFTRTNAPAYKGKFFLKHLALDYQVRKLASLAIQSLTAPTF